MKDVYVDIYVCMDFLNGKTYSLLHKLEKYLLRQQVLNSSERQLFLFSKASKCRLPFPGRQESLVYPSLHFLRCNLLVAYFFEECVSALAISDIVNDVFVLKLVLCPC